MEIAFELPDGSYLKLEKNSDGSVDVNISQNGGQAESHQWSLLAIKEDGQAAVIGHSASGYRQLARARAGEGDRFVVDWRHERVYRAEGEDVREEEYVEEYGDWRGTGVPPRMLPCNRWSGEEAADDEITS